MTGAAPGPGGPLPFSEVQRLKRGGARALLALVPVAAGLWSSWRTEIPPFVVIPGTVAAALGVFLWSAERKATELRTRLSAEGLTVELEPRLRRSIPFAEVRDCRLRTYDAEREFGGRGIREGSGWAAYTAGGSLGVEIELVGGERLLVGSRFPEVLAALLRNKAAEAREALVRAAQDRKARVPRASATVEIPVPERSLRP